MSEFVRRRAIKIAEERYPMPAHGPMQQPTRIARDGFVDGMVTMAESMRETTGDTSGQAEELLSQLEKLWRDEGKVRSYLLADILIAAKQIDALQISVDANCPECDYPSIVAQTKPDLSIIRTVCPSCDWRDEPTPGVV